jgi:hypothetical protein
VARTFALRNRYRIDPDQELLALGSANLAVGLGHGYPVAGGMSQSAVNAAAGARTPLALVAASLVIAAILLFATGLTRNLPEPLLAAVVLGAVRGLFDPAELVFLWRASRPEFRVALVALAGVLVLGVLRGVVVAAILSVVTLIRRAERPPTAVLGRIAGTDRFRNLENHPEATTLPAVLVFRVEGGLVYFNVENVRSDLLRRVEAAAHRAPGLGERQARSSCGELVAQRRQEARPGQVDVGHGGQVEDDQVDGLRRRCGGRPWGRASAPSTAAGALPSWWMRRAQIARDELGRDSSRLEDAPGLALVELPARGMSSSAGTRHRLAPARMRAAG